MGNFVYLIKDHQNDLVKIGFSYNPENRLKQLRSKNSSLTLECKVIAYEFYEFYLHTLFSKYRVHGEWFKDNESIRNYFSDPLFTQHFAIAKKQYENIEIVNLRSAGRKKKYSVKTMSKTFRYPIECEDEIKKAIKEISSKFLNQKK